MNGKRPTSNIAIRHGGDLCTAVQRFGGVADDWLDLSTGISPWVYPAPEITAKQWRDLPPTPDNLIQAAASYYDCSPNALLLSPGSQLSIRLIPMLISRSQSVAIPTLGYQEHQQSWRNAGHQIVLYDNTQQLNDLIEKQQVHNAVVINPNNPSGENMSPALLKTMANRLAGIMLVDEAFADFDDHQSVCHAPMHENIIVLRSIGKFFGMAGARIGFVISEHSLKDQLHALLNPWSINAPAQYVVELALKDTDWHQRQNKRIRSQSAELDQLLRYFLSRFTDVRASHQTQGLFSSVFSDDSFISQLQIKLAEHQIWTRIGDPIDENNWLRIGLPGDRFDKLADAFSDI